MKRKICLKNIKHIAVLFSAIIIFSSIVVALAVSWVYSDVEYRQGETLETTLNVTPVDIIGVNDVVTCSGVLTRNNDGIEGIQVYVDLLDEDGNVVKTLGDTTTDSSGNYVLQWVCDVQAEDYWFISRWDKDSTENPTTNLNMLENPSFEIGGTVPDDWWNYGANGWQGTHEYVTDAYSGNKAVKLTSTNIQGTGTWSQMLVLPDDATELELSGYVKTDFSQTGESGGACVNVDFYGAPSTEFIYLGSWDTFHEYNSVSEYHLLEGSSYVPEGAYQCNVNCVLYNAMGTATFDDIEFVVK